MSASQEIFHFSSLYLERNEDAYATTDSRN